MTIKTFSDPFLEAIYDDRRDCHLRPDDIDKALEFFGPGLVKLYINPMYLSGKTKLDYTFPENLEVVGHAGVAAWELQGEVKEYTSIGTKGESRGDLALTLAMMGDKNSTTEKQVPENKPGDTVLNRPDKVLVASGVITSPVDGKEHQPESKPSQDFDCSASTLEKTPRIMKQGRGRPVDPHAMSKATLWRRAKKLAKQQKEMLPL